VSNVVPFEHAKVPAVLVDTVDSDDLTTGVSGGFAVVSFRGSKWRVKYQGEEHPVMNADGDPVSTLEVVLIKANKAISKNFYGEAYTEGAAEAPTCFSLDGIQPDPSVQSPISATCARCPKNVFGSRITPAGKKAKACSDNRRMAVAPIGDLANTTFGGPMLIRIPAASLADLKTFGEQLKRRGFKYNAISTRLGFDMDASFPKLTFKAVRPLSDEEATAVRAHLDGDIVDRILATAGELESKDNAEITEVAPKDDLFEQPVAPAKPAAAAPKPTVVKAAPAPAAAPAKPAAATFAAKPAVAAKAATGPKPVVMAKKAEPVVTEAEIVTEPQSELDAEIEGILGDLDGLV
jgi:hypothetical protein